MAKQNRDRAQSDAVQRDPDEWVTGDESMTGPQASYLKTLATEAGEDVDEDLTKAEASKKIEELHERTGRGRDHLSRLSRHRRYSAGMHRAQGRYPAAIAVASSAKNTRRRA